MCGNKVGWKESGRPKLAAFCVGCLACPEPTPEPTPVPMVASTPRILPPDTCDPNTAALPKYPYATRDMANEACIAEGCRGLGTQVEQVAMGQVCREMWNSETRGLYMEENLKTCDGAVGWIPGSRPKASAFCVGCPACATPTPAPMLEPTTKPTPEPTPEAEMAVRCEGDQKKMKNGTSDESTFRCSGGCCIPRKDLCKVEKIAMMALMSLIARLRQSRHQRLS